MITNASVTYPNIYPLSTADLVAVIPSNMWNPPPPPPPPVYAYVYVSVCICIVFVKSLTILCDMYSSMWSSKKGIVPLLYMECPPDTLQKVLF